MSGSAFPRHYGIYDGEGSTQVKSRRERGLYFPRASLSNPGKKPRNPLPWINSAYYDSLPLLSSALIEQRDAPLTSRARPRRAAFSSWFVRNLSLQLSSANMLLALAQRVSLSFCSATVIQRIRLKTRGSETYCMRNKKNTWYHRINALNIWRKFGPMALYH